MKYLRLLILGIMIFMFVSSTSAFGDDLDGIMVNDGDPHNLFLPLLFNPTESGVLCSDVDEDGYAVEGGECGLVDCDDGEPDVNPGASEVCNNSIDDDCDGDVDFVDEDCPCSDVDEDGYAAEGGECGLVDCDDGEPDVNPGASEVCNNGIDDDCDGDVDFVDEDCYCSDVDEDGYAVEGGECGLVDCDDGEPDVNPGASEVCDNGIDDDCDGDVDFVDEDCYCSDVDEDGYAVEGGVCGLVDCDDGEPDVNPGASEVCNNGIDDDCDRDVDFVDEDCPCSDGDEDGYAVEGGVCGLVDCDDGEPDVNPGASEVCNNSIDDDCDGDVDFVDEDCSCSDGDEDGYAVEGGVCGLVDCDDGEPDVNPGASEVCNNGIDDDCDGDVDFVDEDCPCSDGDEDGYAVEGGVCGLVDCDDGDPDVNPGASEVCNNGIDDDCDGDVDFVDEDCPCSDGDEDGYAVEGGVCGLVDCDDGEPDVNPGAIEVCDNGIDDDCNGLADAEELICADNPNIIIVGWDGLQRDHFFECYNKELPECANWLPNIGTLSGGEIFNNTITNGSTDTKSGWAQIFTGYNVDVIGVYDLSNYQPIPEGYTVFEKVEDHFGPENVVTMFISAKGVHTGGACIGDPTYLNGEPVIEDLGQPWCITKDHLDYFELDKIQDDDLGNRALELLELHQDDLFLATFIFRTPDIIGHLSGEASIEYSQSFMYNDYWLGLIIDKLQELGIYDQTLVYVASDHGMDEDLSVHLNAPYIIHATNDPLVVRSGDRKDIGPTILERYNISLGAIGPAPPVNGHSLYSIPYSDPPYCVPEGEAYLDYPGAPQCCSGLTLIGLDLKYGGCRVPTGGIGDNSGHCTACGNGNCDAPETICNCPEDCSQ